MYNTSTWRVNALDPGGSDCYRKMIISELISSTDVLSISSEMALRWMLQDLTDDILFVKDNIQNASRAWATAPISTVNIWVL